MAKPDSPAFTAPPGFAERVADSFARQPFMRLIGAELAEVLPGSVTLRLNHRPELTQQHGFLHGGVVGTLADNACGYAAYTLAEPDSSVLTVEYKLNLLAPAEGEQFCAVAKVLRAGRRLVVAQAEVMAGGPPVAVALATIRLLPGRKDSAAAAPPPEW